MIVTCITKDKKWSIVFSIESRAMLHNGRTVVEQIESNLLYLNRGKSSEDPIKGYTLLLSSKIIYDSIHMSKEEIIAKYSGEGYFDMNSPEFCLLHVDQLNPEDLFDFNRED